MVYSWIIPEEAWTSKVLNKAGHVQRRVTSLSHFYFLHGLVCFISLCYFPLWFYSFLEFSLILLPCQYLLWCFFVLLINFSLLFAMSIICFIFLCIFKKVFNNHLVIFFLLPFSFQCLCHNFFLPFQYDISPGDYDSIYDVRSRLSRLDI